jgi:hypothetical protein
LAAPPSTLDARGGAEGADGSELAATASLVVELCRRMRAWDGVAMAIARWGYSRMRIWLDFSGDGGCPDHSADEGCIYGSMLTTSSLAAENEVEVYETTTAKGCEAVDGA